MRRLVATSQLDAVSIFAELFTEHWPAFITQDQGVKPYLARQRAYFEDLDFFLLDDDRVVAAGWDVPVRWNATIEDLPGGYTDALARAVDGHQAEISPDTFVVMGGMVRSDEQGRG